MPFWVTHGIRVQCSISSSSLAWCILFSCPFIHICLNLIISLASFWKDPFVFEVAKICRHEEVIYLIYFPQIPYISNFIWDHLLTMMSSKCNCSFSHLCLVFSCLLKFIDLNNEEKSVSAHLVNIWTLNFKYSEAPLVSCLVSFEATGGEQKQLLQNLFT